MDDITSTLLDGGTLEQGVDRTILRHAVQRVMFCRYSGAVLDVKDAVLIDCSDAGGGMEIVTSAVYEKLLERTGGLDGLRTTLGLQVTVYDGRILFASTS